MSDQVNIKIDNRSISETKYSKVFRVYIEYMPQPEQAY